MKYIAALGIALSIGLSGETAAHAGSTRGPGDHWDSVDPHSTDVYVITFEGLESATISVRGDRSTDLDCYVLDENGGSIVEDSDGTDFCLLQWTPRWTGPFKLKIKNRGSVSNIYRMQTN